MCSHAGSVKHFSSPVSLHSFLLLPSVILFSILCFCATPPLLSPPHLSVPLPSTHLYISFKFFSYSYLLRKLQSDTAPYVPHKEHISLPLLLLPICLTLFCHCFTSLADRPSSVFHPLSLSPSHFDLCVLALSFLSFLHPLFLLHH